MTPKPSPLRNVAGIAAGFAVVFAAGVVLQSVTSSLLAANGARGDGATDASGLLLVTGLLVAFLAGAAGGYVSTVVARGAWAPYGLAAVVLVAGVLMAPDAETDWAPYAPPVVGAIGVLVGGAGRHNRKRY